LRGGNRFRFRNDVAIAIAKDNVAAIAEGDDVAAVAEDDVAVMFVVGVLLLSDRPTSLRRSAAPKPGRLLLLLLLARCPAEAEACGGGSKQKGCS